MSGMGKNAGKFRPMKTSNFVWWEWPLRLVLLFIASAIIATVITWIEH